MLKSETFTYPSKVSDKSPRKRKKGKLLSKRMRDFISHNWLSEILAEIYGARMV